MTQVVEKVRAINLPPHILRQLGLEKNWYEKVSPDFIARVLKTAEKYQYVLKELSKK